MPKENNKKGNSQRIAVWIAMIGLAGTITAALIAVLPNLIELKQISERDADTATTAMGFNKFDEPIGAFSIEYPQDFAFLSKDIRDTAAIYTFGPSKVVLEEGFYKPDFLIYVDFGLNEEPIRDFDSAENFLLEHTFSKVFSKDKSVIVSNEKTDNGFKVHIQQNDPTLKHGFILFEFKDNVIAAVAIFITDNNVPINDDSIDYIFSSFNWSPTKIKKVIGN